MFVFLSPLITHAKNSHHNKHALPSGKYKIPPEGLLNDSRYANDVEENRCDYQCRRMRRRRTKNTEDSRRTRLKTKSSKSQLKIAHREQRTNHRHSDARMQRKNDTKNEKR